MATQWGMERYKGFLIAGSAVPKFATGFDWNSQGTILCPGRSGSTVEIKRIEGPIVNSKDAAEEHGSSCARIGLTTVLTRYQPRRYRSLGGKIVCDRHVVRDL